MHGRFIDVVVEEQEGIPDGCELRFHAVGESRPVKRVLYAPMTGPEGEYEVTAAAGSRRWRRRSTTRAPGRRS